jgi:hypothetical protein
VPVIAGKILWVEKNGSGARHHRRAFVAAHHDAVRAILVLKEAGAPP